MIQLTDNIQWDENLEFSEQTNECRSFVQNVIDTYNKVSTKEAIPMSSLHRILTAIYTLENGVKIIERFEYTSAISDAGWAQVETYKIQCNG